MPNSKLFTGSVIVDAWIGDVSGYAGAFLLINLSIGGYVTLKIIRHMTKFKPTLLNKILIVDAVLMAISHLSLWNLAINMILPDSYPVFKIIESFLGLYPGSLCVGNSGLLVFRVLHNFTTGLFAALYRLLYLKASSSYLIWRFLNSKLSFVVFLIATFGISYYLTGTHLLTLDREKYAFPVAHQYGVWMCQSTMGGTSYEEFKIFNATLSQEVYDSFSKNRTVSAGFSMLFTVLEMILLGICFSILLRTNSAVGLDASERIRRKRTNAMTITGHLIIFIFDITSTIGFITANSVFKNNNGIRFWTGYIRMIDTCLLPLLWFWCMPELRRTVNFFSEC